MESRVQGSLFYVQETPRRGRDVGRDAKPMIRCIVKRLQNQELERSLQVLAAFHRRAKPRRKFESAYSVVAEGDYVNKIKPKALDFSSASEQIRRFFRAQRARMRAARQQTKYLSLWAARLITRPFCASSSKPQPVPQLGSASPVALQAQRAHV
jgi:hypothetical protein